jgi:hypothetical protein
VRWFRFIGWVYGQKYYRDKEEFVWLQREILCVFVKTSNIEATGYTLGFNNDHASNKPAKVPWYV